MVSAIRQVLQLSRHSLLEWHKYYFYSEHQHYPQNLSDDLTPELLELLCRNDILTAAVQTSCVHSKDPVALAC